MKLNVPQQIELLGDLVSPQPAHFLNTGPCGLPPVPQRVKIVTHSAVVVEPVCVRGLMMDLVTPVTVGELHNATHRLPLHTFGDN